MDISVIIPLYNKADTIERAVYSVLAQTHKPKEIIIVDDGSTDNPITKLKNFDDKRIILLQQSNRGVAVARNTGIHHAISEWIAFLDADDEWKPDFLATIVTLHNNYINADVLATSYELTTDNIFFKKLTLHKIPFKNISGILSNYFEVAACSMPPIWSSAVVISKGALQHIGGFPHNIDAGEDILTWARLASKFLIGYNTTSLSVYHVKEDRIYKSGPSRSPDVKNTVGKELELLYRGNPISGLKEYISLWYKMRASIYLRLGDNKNALQEIKNSLKYNFTWKVLLYTCMIVLPLNLRLKFFARFAK